jgi:hypothetical protein
MQTPMVDRLAALTVSLGATFSLVWAHASLAYPILAAAPLVVAQACR